MKNLNHHHHLSGPVWLSLDFKIGLVSDERLSTNYSSINYKKLKWISPCLLIIKLFFQAKVSALAVCLLYPNNKNMQQLVVEPQTRTNKTAT